MNDVRDMEPTTCVEAEPFALMVKDDSMEPEFAEGCIITVDPTGVARDGAFVLAEVDDVWVFRQLVADGNGFALRALAPGHAPVSIGRKLSAVKGVITQRAGRRRSYHKRYDLDRDPPASG